MAKAMRIDFVSDITCPWCVIGLGGLDQALEALKGEIDATLHFQPFELNPDMPPGGRNTAEIIAQKYGRTAEEVVAGRTAIQERARQVGFSMNTSDQSRSYNTFNAHRLLHWAGEEHPEKQPALKRAIFEANFTNQTDPGDADILAAAAERAGLDPEAAREVVTSGRYAQEVREAEELWRSRGINSVPAIIIDEKWLISGGQPAAVFEETLRNIAAEKEAVSA